MEREYWKHCDKPAARYFLEANPSPMFLGFESRCGLPITEALVELLLREE